MSRSSTPTSAAGAGDPVADRRAADFRRMRALATLLLAAMTGVYIAATLGAPRYPWLAYARAFAEAGMVGACADWFAVVALFRHPMGIPIPHTAIVPSNKTRIAGAMGRFIANNFLTPKVLSRRLAEIDLARWIAAWLAQPENAGRIARGVVVAIPEIVDALPREQMSGLIGKSIMRGLEAMPAAPVASNLLAIAWAQGQTGKLIERGLEFAESSILRNKGIIRAKVEAHSSRWIPKWVDGIFADKVTAAIAATLAEMRDPAHPWRLELKTAVETLARRLATDAKLRADVEAGKHQMLKNPLVRDQIDALWAEIEDRVPASLAAHAGAIQDGIERALVSSGQWLRDDPELASRFNRWARYLARRAISPRRAEIGEFATRVVNDWNADTLVERIELQVGKDLQYIRVNGTLVGGLVGLVIFILSKWLPGG